MEPTPGLKPTPNTLEDDLKDLISKWEDKLTEEEIKYFLRTAAEYYQKK